jgi:hypothetical protein
MTKTKEIGSLKKQAKGMRKESAHLRMESVNANSCVTPTDTTSSKANGSSWVAGQSGNPAGRPLGARQKIATQLLEDLQEVWQEKGKTILYRMAIEEPSRLAQIAYGILPKEAFVKVENAIDPRLKALQNMDAEALAALGGLIDAIKAAKVDGEPGKIFAWIEEDLRARLATEIDGFGSKAVATAPANENKSDSDQ